ncbi:MAG TPA: Uma2 family endonuclease [Blastocatellia bacterium]|nr:Uma2 family endonuclease [Blastocatellia bacterium]
MTTKVRVMIEDLYYVPEDGKAEIVNGELVQMAPTGFLPNRASSMIHMSLYQHERKTNAGYAIADNAGFRVSLPNRDSFSPDAAWYTGRPTGMKFLEGAPIFALEVRSDADYGPQRIAEKRRDYFAAGTICVWDVDLLSPDVIKSYDAGDPENPIVFRRGDIAHAETAVPGWTLAVDDLFRDEE